MVAAAAAAAPNRVHLEIDLNVNLQRLRDLYSILTYALSKETNHGCIPFIRSKWTALWHTLQGVPIPYELEFTPEEDIEQISTYIHLILQFLDDILSDGILVYDKRLSTALRGQDAQSSNKQDYTKLTVLTDLIYWRYKPVTTTSESTTVDILHKLSDESLSKFISFSLGFFRDRQLVEDMSQLIVIANRIFPHAPSLEEETPSNHDFENEHLVAAKHAKKFSARSTQLFHLLSQGIGRCGMEHTANIHLSGFGSRDPEIDMLLSTCAEHSLGSGWYPIRCREQSLSNDQHKSLINVCEHLQESIKRRLPMQLNYDDQKIWKGRVVSVRPRKIHNTALCYRTLRDFIQQGSETQDDRQDRSRFQEKDRRKLQCLLAQSMFYLFHSPWLPQAWDLSGIKFTQDESSYNIGKPYASCALSQSTFLERGSSYNDHDGRLFMAKFGFLLLQIELGGELELTEDEKEDDELGIETALDRHIESRSGDIKDPVKRVLYACLDFYDHVEQIDSPMVDNDLKSHLVILNRILDPLKKVLEMNYSTVANEIPDLMYSASTTVQEHSHQDNLRTWSPSGDLGRSRSPPFAPGLLNSSIHERFDSRTPSPQLLGVAVAHSTRVMMSKNSFEEKSTSFVSIQQHSPTSFPTSPNPLVLFDEDDHASGLSDRSKSNYALDFFQLYDAFHARYMMPHRIRTRIKIAVLDTGIDINQPSISGHLDVIKMARWQLTPGKLDNPIKAKESFVGGPPTDQCGHGTRVVELLLKVAPYADLYLAKISNGLRDGYAGSANSVAEAIRWAVKHEVDIITMSFGLSGWDSAVNSAIHEATKTSVLFAAASNGGGNGKRTYPATDSGVFCIHASDGKGNDYGGLNPSTESFSDSWTTLGVAIPFDNQSVCKSGTSFAAPIAAGTIANVFDHLEHLRDQNKIPLQKYRHLRSSDGVSRILWHMSKERQGFRYLAPWNLWDCLCEDSEENIGQSQEHVRLKLLMETG